MSQSIFPAVGTSPGPGSVSTTELGGDITTAGKALLDDADAAAQRTTLGVAAAPTGTPDGTKYLRDDNSWQAVSGGSGLTQPQVMARTLGC